MKHLPELSLGLEELRQRIAGLEGIRREAATRTIGSGCDALDESLPEKGFRSGTLIEWFSAGEGSGAGTLALLAARQACRDGGRWSCWIAAEIFAPRRHSGWGSNRNGWW